MRFLRQSLSWLLFFAQCFALTPLQAIASYPQLSTLQSYIAASSNFTGLLSNANNFTFLAPSNDAWAAFASQNGNITNSPLLEATLQYSLLLGGYSSLSFSKTPQFIASNLVNATYSNVTGGQRVELVLGSDGTPQAVSSNKSIGTSSSTDIISEGGIIHIINEVLAVPISAVLEFTAAGLEYFISILNNGGYLSSTMPYVNAVLELKDVTYFVPNTAEALANATAFAANSTTAQQQAMFEYHLIPGVVAYSNLLTNGTQLKTAQGNNVTITIQDGDTYVNAAKIISFDYIVANGVFHVIDDILNVNNTSPPPPASTSSSAPTSTSSPTSSPTPTAEAKASTASANPSSKSLSTGAKAGIGVSSGIAGLLILAALVWFLLRSRKRNRESRAWEDQNMVPNDLGRFYVRRGTVQRQQDLGLGLQSTGLDHDAEPVPPRQGSKGVSYDSSTTPTQEMHGSSRPSIPPRSPNRMSSGNEYF